MTENEAKAKWCPFARVVTGPWAVAVNRVVDLKTLKPHLPGTTMCIGSKCMAWQASSSSSGWCDLVGRQP